MADLIAELTLDAMQMDSVAKVTEETPGQGEKFWQRIDAQLGGLERRSPDFGDSVTTAGRKREDSVEQAGRKIESVCHKMEKAFGAARWGRLLDAFAPIHAGAYSAGGPVRRSFNEGGHISGPTGTDTVSAWLTPGEFVVNAGATQRNAAWLDAINEGATLPGNAQRFASGGLVQPGAPPVQMTNNITINPPPGTNPREIARMVFDEIKRLERRGR